MDNDYRFDPDGYAPYPGSISLPYATVTRDRGQACGKAHVYALMWLSPHM